MTGRPYLLRARLTDTCLSIADNDDTWVPVPGNVQLHCVENVTITNVTFVGLGATALVVDDQSQSVTVANCTFRDVSCGGIYIGQVRTFGGACWCESE